MAENSPRRVVITGMGLVSPLGNSDESLWNALQAQRSGVAPLQGVPTQYLPSTFGGEARDFTGTIDDFGDLDKEIKRNIRKNLKVMCREIEMGVAAAQLAIAHANLSNINPDRTGVIYGSDYIMTKPDEFVDGVRKCLDENGEFDFTHWGDVGLGEVTPLWLLKYLPNMPASHIAIYNDFRGPNNSITVREASSNLAIGEAYATIARGWADTLIAGATGTRVHPMRTIHMALQEEIAQGDIDPAGASRPFDKNRSGMVLGEGAGAIVLEEYEFAVKRGASILGEVVGYGSSTVIDREHVAHYDRAIENAIVAALRKADMKPAEVGHIHAHGLSTQRCDAEEAQGLIRLFGAAETSPPVTAAKSYFGNLGAGSGLIELMSSLLAVKHGPLFPVLNHETVDPDCRLRIAKSGDAAGDSFVNVNVTPQGQASAVVVRKAS
ncbi:beta-ketoacyl-[acyl-carrier-protein] synthase family protein [Lignipirellula cremea]|uniref:3-oxoacyl-[acyl-carrier-protein] synthase 2 n=1 Tax=Lignipirellula cremea TaxID=2528010 RepID=A0A518DWX7_9BACT|nr:beta-ketoacyl-[acyl-carrier-protein] synthase family protein [Lignipirellula cremea]QDU96339.1 3-oxoacyl-[acyl-carrier-protein] synthase 2 [Lignipirellula cremea]